MAEEYRSEDQRIRTLEEITPKLQRSLGELQDAVAAIQQARVRQSGVTVDAPIALLPPTRDSLIASATSPLLAGITGIAGILPDVMGSGLNDILETLKQYIKNPTEIVTGPRRTGSRPDTVKSWKEHCQREGHTLKQDCPLKSAKLDLDVWDMVGTKDIKALLTLTWSYDCCNVYDVDASLKVQRNDSPKDFGIFIIERYSIPETDPVELAICHPCTPKCLRAQISIIVYGAGIGSVPGIERKMDLDIFLCPSSNGTPKIQDKTDYTQNHGDSSGATPSDDKTPYDDGTWGVKKKGKETNT